MAGGSDTGGYVYKGKHISLKDKKKQNDNHITGETWKLIPNTDFAFYSTQGRFCTSQNIDWPHSGAYLCTEQEIKEQVNYMANLENILNEAEGYTNIDYYSKWVEKEKHKEIMLDNLDKDKHID
jgi:hypothetical protein